MRSATSPPMALADARRLLLDDVAALDAEDRGLLDAAGCVLAEPVVADRDLPPTDRSAMDGFAVRASDCDRPGCVVPVDGEVRAGEPAGSPLPPGTARRIYTGGVIPPGADCVVMVELTREDRAAGTVELREQPAAGQHVRHRAEDLRQGHVVLEPGAVIQPAEVATLASLGRTRVRVVRRPRVAVLSTGDEVVPASSTPEPHQVRNSNAWSLVAQLAEMELCGTDLGIVPDRPEALDAAIARGLAFDVLLLTGGVSVGEYDLVAEALGRAGMRRLFHRVAMKPGKPVLAGRCGGCLVVGLPGNPVSAFTGFLVLVAPALRVLSGLPRARSGPLEVPATAASRFRRSPDRTTFHLARVEPGRPWTAAAVRTSGSGDVPALRLANAFAVTEPGRGALEEGEPIPAIPWPGFERRG